MTESTLIAASLVFLRFRLRLFLLHLGHLEDGAVDLSVQLVLVEGDRPSLPLRRTLAVGLDGVRIEKAAADVLVVADGALALDLLSLHLALRFGFDDQVTLSVDVLGGFEALLGGDFE